MVPPCGRAKFRFIQHVCTHHVWFGAGKTYSILSRAVPSLSHMSTYFQASEPTRLLVDKSLEDLVVCR